MTTRIYRSDDVSAPVLNGQVGSLITVLTKCLVDGYPGKAAAGWTLALSGTNKAIFRNSNTLGTGTYYRIQDNGLTKTNYATVQGNIASICGMTSYTDIDTPTLPFPRVLAGGDYHSTLSYGLTIQKRKEHDVNLAYTAPWIVIADERTCYLITGWTSANTNATSNIWTTSRGVYGFGDLEMFNAADAISARAFVFGGSLESTGWFDHPVNGREYREFSIGYFEDSRSGLGTNHMLNRIFLNRCQENGAYTVKGRIFGENYDSYGGSCVAGIGEGRYIRYSVTGSPTTGGVVLNPLMVCEDTSDTIRTTEYEPQGILAHARLRGLKGCMHTTDAANAYKLTSEGTTLSIGGVDHLIFSTLIDNGGAPVSNCMAISLGDWA
jgi:hypothetical protein